MPVIKDRESSKVPADLQSLIDAHVHIFPGNIFSAIWKWFDANAWPVRYRMSSFQILEFLLSRGVTHVIALQYAHKPGIAGKLNAHMVKMCKEFNPRVTGMATVFPGEDDASTILQHAFDSGLDGLKLHAHVQCFDMNSQAMYRLYEYCQSNGKPVVMHVGREPKSTAYNCDPYQLCSAEKLEAILKDFPDLRICVPHLGFDELTAYRELIEKYDNLWLDTTLVITDYFPIEPQIALRDYRPDRVMYGTDFPNIPYAWDRELKELTALDITQATLERIAYKNAVEFFAIKLPPN
jgi:predicted TIM-barrel fold metal-dependent hydrolase